MSDSTDNGRPTIVVVNGTADEGCRAAHYLLELGQFNVRATARRLSGARIMRLQQLGRDGQRVEIVHAANDDRNALSRAFEGAAGIYGTSVYNIYARQYRPANPEEMAQCRAVIDAARTCTTLEHFIWQTMTRFDLPPESIGLEAPIHFRTKWHWEDRIKEAGLPWTFLRQPAYMRQIKFGMYYRNRLVWPYAPDARLAFAAEEDLGKFVASIFADRDAHMHKAVNGVTEVVTPAEVAARAHAVNTAFSPNYRQATAIENAFFDQFIVRLKPAFRYPSQINRNLKAGNYFDMTLDDKAYCQQLIAPLQLTTLEDWLRAHFDGAG